MKKRKDLRRQPRWLQKIIAYIGRYWWRRCPLCEKYFGGHEWAEDKKMLIPSCGMSYEKEICKNCEDKAEMMNKEEYEADKKEIERRRKEYEERENRTSLAEEEVVE